MLPLLLVLACSTDQQLGRIPDAPSVLLDALDGADALRQGQGTVLITGTVSDSYDAPDSLSLTWDYADLTVDDVSDAAGNVSLEIDIDLLAPGPQVVHLVAVDSDGDYGDDSLDLVIWGPLGAPTVLITDPDDGSTFDLGATITFQGEASDAATAAEDLAFAWQSNIDGPLSGEVSADGKSILVTGDLSEGSHRVTLSATDTDGELGSDSITVTVGEPELDDPVDADPGDIVFSEMMINPQLVADEVGEWVELYNTSGSPIEIEGYTFRDDDYDYWVLEGSMIVPPHDYFVLCADTDPTVNGGIICDGWFLRDPDTPGLALANAPDEVVLMRPDGVEIDWVYYTDDWYTPAVALGVDPGWLDSGANDDITHWCDQTTVLSSGLEPGTPGLVNDPC